MTLRAAVTDAQIELVPSIQAVHRSNGRRIRALLVKAIEVNGLSRSDLAHESALDGSEITRILEAEGERHIPARLIAAVMARDHARVFLAGLAEMTGYEVRPKVADLAAENRALRSKLAALRSELDTLLDESP